MTGFSIIVPTWNNLDYLDLAYRSLTRHSAAAHEIIVFFNEIDERAARWAGERGVRHASSPQNLGVCGAVNRAAAMATREFLCFFNDDMVALPGWDTAFAPYLGLADKLWLSGTAVEAGKATACYLGGHDYGSSPADFQEERLLGECGRLVRPYNVVSTWTPIVMPRRNWEEVGGFDEAYFPGNGSDPDLAMKMYAFGCRRFIGVGASLVYHFSRRTVSRFDGQELMDPKAYFKTKWGMSWKRFLNGTLHRDEVITPDLVRRLGWEEAV